jgi:hypothetical protein
MEQLDVISNQESYDKSIELLNSSLEMQRFSFYKQKAYSFTYATRKETDTHVYWSLTEAKPRFENNRLFYSRNNRYGATYDKAKNDFKLWFGKPAYEIPGTLMSDIIAFFKLEWYVSMSSSLQSLLNATMLKNMVKGKITNPRDYVRAYLKTSPYKKMDVSVELFYKVFNNGNINSPKSFRKILEYSTNVNHVLEFLGETSYPQHSINDLYDQAAILNRKVNPKWSDARKKEVHSQWTRDIMEMEIKSIEPYDYNYSPIDLPKGLEIIADNYELFEEGTTMKHCVYTNYESRIKNKKYFTFRYIKDGVRATVGVDRSYSDEATFSQMYGIGNSSIDPEHMEPIKEFIKTKYFQDWIKEQAGSNKIKEFEVEDAAWF